MTGLADLHKCSLDWVWFSPASKQLPHREFYRREFIHEMITVASDLVKGPISASIIRNPHDKRNVTSKPQIWLRTDDA